MKRNFPIDEFGISFAHSSGVIRQAFSAAELACEEYFFCGPIAKECFCLFRVYPEWPLKYPMVLCSLRDSELTYSDKL